MQIGGKICLNGKAKFCQKTFKMPNYYIFFDLAASESIFEGFFLNCVSRWSP